MYFNNRNKIDDDYSITNQDLASIETYLNQYILELSTNDGEIHSAYELLGNDFSKKELYIWALSVEISPGETQSTSGVSAPLLLKIEQKDNRLHIVDHRFPSDGTLYNRDIKRMFPEEVQEKIWSFNSSKLWDEIVERVE
jgi:hypothetical protein